MSHEVVLSGCTSTPLAGYLKALGVHRLVAEQADTEARGYWRNDQYVLVSRLNLDQLHQFFLEEYKPTPLVAPWGARSGFYPGSSETKAREAIELIESSGDQRLSSFRQAITSVRRLLNQHGFESKVKDEDKLTLLRACRSELPDNLLSWLDACYVLTSKDRRFPPLLGTGGNEGSGSYVSGFAQQVVDCIARRAQDKSLSASLFSAAVPASTSGQTPGQFAPNASGGPNLTSGFSAQVATNPWDYILCLEGTLLFGSAATRRLDSSASSSASFPFTVNTTGSGSGAIAQEDEKEGRAEMWLPIWGRSMGLNELSNLMSEGRVQLSGRHVRDGLDFVRAVSHLGVERGISAFERYSILQRFGQNVFAVPLNRVAVKRNPTANLIDELDDNKSRHWLESFRAFGRGKNAADRIESVVRRLEDGLFDLSTEGENAAPKVQKVLEVLGEAHIYFGHSSSAREACPPVPWLSREWFLKANDNSPEFAVAAALSGLHARMTTEEGREQYGLHMRIHLTPEQEGPRPDWTDTDSHWVTWGHGRLEDNLATTLRRRLLVAEQQDLPDKPLRSLRNAPLDAIAAWLVSGLDSSRIAALLPGLSLVRIPAGFTRSGARAGVLPAAYRVLKPFFCTDEQLSSAGLIESGTHLPIPPELIRRLAANDTAGAVSLAQQRLRIAGIAIRFPELQASRMDGRRLLAALMVPVSDGDLRTLLPARILHTNENRIKE